MGELEFKYLEVYSASQGSVDTNRENNRGFGFLKKIKIPKQ